MLGWFNTKELDAFADSLVAELLERVPPSGGRLAGTKAFERMARTFGTTFERIDAFARSQRMNVYKKAHFANRIRVPAREHGRDPVRPHPAVAVDCDWVGKNIREFG